MHMSSAKNRCTRCIQAILKAVAVIVLILVVCMFISPARNLVLWPFWPNAWRKVATLDILEMERSVLPSNVTRLACCPRAKSQPLPRESLDRSLINTYTDVMRDAGSGKLQDERHLAFLPALPFKDKLDLVWLLAVMAHALSDAKVEFFMRGGSLLGVARHRGIIPWDDDIDVAINVSQWVRTREALTCVRGYELYVSPKMHWKFMPAGRAYPFIDIFFYAENDLYMWALTRYTRPTFTLLKEDVLPLQPAIFEGVPVLQPRRVVKITKELYSYNRCESRSLDHRSGLTFRRVVVVPCSSLNYLYKMYDLDE